MATINVEMIDKLNAEIEGVTSYADVIVKEINNKIAVDEDKAQQFIDKKMTELSKKMTEKAEPIRQKIIDIFSAQYQSALEKLKPIMPLVEAAQGSISLDTVVDVVKSILAVLITPYQPIIEFTLTVMPKVLELSANLQKLASYQPQINIPDGSVITIPPLNVEIEPITTGDIMG